MSSFVVPIQQVIVGHAAAHHAFDKLSLCPGGSDVAGAFDPFRAGIEGSAEPRCFDHLVGLTRSQLVATRQLPAAERRLLTTHFQTSFHWAAIRPQLPFPLVVPAGIPTPPPRHYRSHYLWLPPDDIATAGDLVGLDDFDLALRLFDFSAWRPILAQRFASHFGPSVFDPVSLGLGTLLARWPAGGGPSSIKNCTRPNAGRATAAVSALTPTTCRLLPPGAWP